MSYVRVSICSEVCRGAGFKSREDASASSALLFEYRQNRVGMPFIIIMIKSKTYEGSSLRRCPVFSRVGVVALCRFWLVITSSFEESPAEVHGHGLRNVTHFHNHLFLRVLTPFLSCTSQWCALTHEALLEVPAPRGERLEPQPPRVRIIIVAWICASIAHSIIETVEIQIFPSKT